MSVPDTLAETPLAGLLGMWHISLLLIGEGGTGVTETRRNVRRVTSGRRRTAVCEGHLTVSIKTSQCAGDILRIPPG